MYGIIIWLSAQAQSALIVTDGGTNLAFGCCNTETAAPFSIGDLVFAKGMRADQGEFFAGLRLIIPGFWPEVNQTIASYSAPSKCLTAKKSVEMMPRIALTGALTGDTSAASNITTAPSRCIEKLMITAIK